MCLVPWLGAGLLGLTVPLSPSGSQSPTRWLRAPREQKQSCQPSKGQGLERGSVHLGALCWLKQVTGSAQTRGEVRKTVPLFGGAAHVNRGEGMFIDNPTQMSS